jgi:gas vesicle protein
MNNSSALLLILLTPLAAQADFKTHARKDIEIFANAVKETTAAAFDKLNTKLLDLGTQLRSKSKITTEQIKADLTFLQNKLAELSAQAKGKSAEKLNHLSHETQEAIHQLKTASVRKTQRIIQRLANSSQQIADYLNSNAEELNK